MNLIKKFYKKAFTLSEVLITIVIIGIVVAITLPTLITNYQKKQTVARLKKIYSEIAQAFTLAETEYGSMENWDYRNFPYGDDSQEVYFVKNYILSNLETIKVCSGAAAITECRDGSSFVKSLDGRNALSASARTTYVITASGYDIFFSPGGPSNLSLTSKYTPHIHMFVDIDGPRKGKNIIGKDIFMFSAYFGQGKLDGESLNIPSGFGMYGRSTEPLTRDDIINNLKDDTKQHGCRKEYPATGRMCGLLIQYDGWKISDDYPWQ